jgi:tetratricopeptide (TPR) repeat protein
MWRKDFQGRDDSRLDTSYSGTRANVGAEPDERVADRRAHGYSLYVRMSTVHRAHPLPYYFPESVPMRFFRSHLALFAAAVFLATPADAQRAPRRPVLPAAADTNDARAYYDLGVRSMARRPDLAADAFYWAVELRPGWADALYGRHTAMLLRDPRRMILYQSSGRARSSAEARQIDSLYLRALRSDPFVQRRFEPELTRMWVGALIVGGDPTRVDDQTLLSYYTDQVMMDLPPVMRARVKAAQGKLPEAVQAFGEALRSRRNSESRGWILQERARMFALVGNDERALADFDTAVSLQVERDERELVRFYESKAVLHHSRGLIFERAGKTGEAREAYSRALEEDLSYAPAHLRLGLLALAEGDTATAEGELRLAAETAPDDATVRILYGTLLSRLRRLDEAAAQLDAATMLAPHHADGWLVLGMVKQLQGDTEGTLKACREYLARAPRNDPRRPQVEALVATAPEGQ